MKPSQPTLDAVFRQCNAFCAFAVCLLVLYGCNRDLTYLLQKDDVWTLSVFEGGRETSRKEIGRDSPLRAVILDWAKRNASGWTVAPQTFVPDVLVSGQSFQLNFRPDFAVIGSNGWQCSKGLPADEYARLRGALSATQ